MASLCDNFQEQTLKAAVDRMSADNMLDIPIVLESANGMYAVHEKGLIGYDIETYTAQEFQEEFADKNYYTWDQYQKDFKAIDFNRIGGPVDDNFWAEKHDAVKWRIGKIEEDIAESGLDLKGPALDLCGPGGQ